MTIYMEQGFLIVPEVLDEARITAASALLGSIDRDAMGVMAHRDLFAVRDVLGLLPDLLSVVWSPALSALVDRHCGPNAFLTKSIFFDKPAGSNWFVAYHQDISIQVAQRAEVEGFSQWTSKHGVIGVIPPAHFLERTLTVRLHLDDTDATNGALRVISGSHAHGIQRERPYTEQAVVCPVPAGGAMLMRPLLMHASRRSTSAKPRRVLHLEFNDLELPEPLQWAERRVLPE